MADGIRRASSDDLDGLVPLFDAYRSFFTGDSPAGSRAFLQERLRLQDSVILISSDDGTVTGFLQLYPLFSSWYARRIWFLSDLYVAEAYRKRRIARALVAAAEGFARDGGSPSIMVEIPHSEPHLIAFYENAGYQKDKTFDLYRLYLAP